MPGFYMATNKKYLLLAIILFGFMPFLPAQTRGQTGDQTAGYFTEEGVDNGKIFQRFTWKGGEYALRYEVIFERENNGAYRAHLRETTTSHFIEVSLPPGKYRFRVIPYDILGRPAEGSPWAEIEVLSIPRQKPEIESAFNSVPEPEPESAAEPEPEKPEPEPESEVEPEPEKPEPEKTVFFRIGAAFGVGGSLTVYGNKFFDDPDVGLRTSIVFKTPYDIYVGPELTGDINRYGNLEKWKMYFFTFGLNLLAEKWLPNKIFGVGLKLGMIYPSIDISKNWHGKNRDELDYFREDDVGIIVAEEGFYADRLIPNIGASFYWLIKKHFLLEIGFNYMHIFNTSSGYFRPMLGISYQF
jgi:hypothetical protein